MARPSGNRFFDVILIDHSKFNKKSSISLSELNLYRQKYLASYLVKEVGELSHFEEDVLKSLNDQYIISEKEVLGDTNTNVGFGPHLADMVASIGGSWKFIIIFGLIIFVWILTNIIFLSDKGFDPYPFILLNLILSCLAALQAPVIMMSQNRQEEKDRERTKHDYMVNLKAELEIRTLHEKLDHLIIHQQQELLNIQQVHVEMLEDIMKRIDLK